MITSSVICRVVHFYINSAVGHKSKYEIACGVFMPKRAMNGHLVHYCTLIEYGPGASIPTIKMTNCGCQWICRCSHNDYVNSVEWG